MDEAIKEAMDRICAHAVDLGRRDFMHAPFPLDEHTIATDGFALLATDGRHAAEREKDIPTESIRGILASRDRVSHCLELAELLRWIGDDPACDACKGRQKTKCDACNGEKTVTHDCDCPYCQYSGEEECDECGGTGSVSCECMGEHNTERIRFFGWLIDRRLLRRSLPKMTGPVTVGTLAKKTDQVMIRHEDWTLVVMPMADRNAPIVGEYPQAEAAQ